MSEHLSASARRIAALEAELARYQQMQREYFAFMNYVVVRCGKRYDSNGCPIESGYDTDPLNLEKTFTIHSDILKKIPILGIRTKISADGKTMTLTRVSGEPNGKQRPLIVRP